MLFVVIEHYRDGNPVPIYRRLRDRGRQTASGVEYRGSWVTEDLAHCYQVMECQRRADLDQWIANWQDLVDFEVIPVVPSAQAQGMVASRL
jgi:hypothetical protein